MRYKGREIGNYKRREENPSRHSFTKKGEKSPF